MIIKTSDGKAFKIFVYFSLDAPTDGFDSDFILGSKNSVLDRYSPAFFDRDFNEFDKSEKGTEYFDYG